MSDKWCCFCGQQGHLSNKCPWPKDIPPQPIPQEPVVIPIEDDENWMEYYGGY